MGFDHAGSKLDKARAALDRPAGDAQRYPDMKKTMAESEIDFLHALQDATASKLIVWEIVQDEQRDPGEQRDIFAAQVDGETVEIELVYFEVATGGVFERLIAIVSGLGVYFRAAVGTRQYDMISAMLSRSIPRWDSGHAGAESALARATDRVNSLGSGSN